MRNGFEEAARMRKALRIISAIPLGETAEEIAKAGDWLEGLPQSDRDVLAAKVGVKSPSPETWALVVSTQRGRRPIADVFARIARSAR